MPRHMATKTHDNAARSDELVTRPYCLHSNTEVQTLADLNCPFSGFWVHFRGFEVPSRYIWAMLRPGGALGGAITRSAEAVHVKAMLGLTRLNRACCGDTPVAQIEL